MKKFLILAVVAVIISFSSYSQSNDSIKTALLAVEKIDSIQYSKISNIEAALLNFKKDNRTSQLFMVIGSVLYVAGILSKDIDNGKISPLIYAGGVCSLAGTVTYLISFSHLQFKKKPKQRAVVDTYNW